MFKSGSNFPSYIVMPTNWIETSCYNSLFILFIIIIFFINQGEVLTSLVKHRDRQSLASFTSKRCNVA